MEVISLEPKYVPVFQKPKCCAVACLQMILYRKGFGLYDQEDLAIEFGVKIGEGDRDAFRETMPIMSSFKFDEGISTVDSVPRVNDFFEKSGIPLLAQGFKTSSIPSVGNLITDALTKNKDVWVEYHSDEVHPKGNVEIHPIHDAVLESFDVEKGILVLIDPKPTRKQRVSVSLDVLERAMSTHFGKETGLVIVEKTS